EAEARAAEHVAAGEGEAGHKRSLPFFRPSPPKRGRGAGGGGGRLSPRPCALPRSGGEGGRGFSRWKRTRWRGTGAGPVPAVPARAAVRSRRNVAARSDSASVIGRPKASRQARSGASSGRPPHSFVSRRAKAAAWACASGLLSSVSACVGTTVRCRRGQLVIT